MTRHHASLEVISDGSGTVVLGWVDETVLYTQLRGALSADLGARFATRLEKLIETTTAIRYFSDARDLTEYDLLARSAFVRVFLANRARISSLVMLTWTEGVGPAARAVVSALSLPTEVLTDALDFEARLRRAAPFALRQLASEAAKNPAIRANLTR
jgi:hypothetical protein